jgi:hypothetical protein
MKHRVRSTLLDVFVLLESLLVVGQFVGFKFFDVVQY